ncbi:MAG: hypothetical protein WCS43_04170 [Verrucomicrobiota bacterium]
MKTSTVQITLWLIFCAAFSSANPVLVESSINKTWERCLISVSKDMATVSCAVGYGVHKYPPSELEVLVPVVWQQGKSPDAAPNNPDTKDFMKSCDPRIEIGRSVFKPDKITFRKDESLSKDLSVAICHFTIRIVIPKSFSIVVSYEQPIYNEHVYYLPLFEDQRSPEQSDAYTVSLFPTRGVRLKLSSKHAYSVIDMSTRVTIHPCHNEMIAVKVKPVEVGDGGSGKPVNFSASSNP